MVNSDEPSNNPENNKNRKKWIGCGVLIALIVLIAIIIGVAVPKGGKSSEGETTTTIKPTKTINFTNVEFEPEVTINEDENEGNDEDKVNGITGSPETEAPETEVPEAEVPETEGPDTEVPETEVPETEVPETSVSTTSSADTSTTTQSTTEKITTLKPISANTTTQFTGIITTDPVLEENITFTAPDVEIELTTSEIIMQTTRNTENTEESTNFTKETSNVNVTNIDETTNFDATTSVIDIETTRDTFIEYETTASDFSNSTLVTDTNSTIIPDPEVPDSFFTFEPENKANFTTNSPSTSKNVELVTTSDQDMLDFTNVTLENEVLVTMAEIFNTTLTGIEEALAPTDSTSLNEILTTGNAEFTQPIEFTTDPNLPKTFNLPVTVNSTGSEINEEATTEISNDLLVTTNRPRPPVVETTTEDVLNLFTTEKLKAETNGGATTAAVWYAQPTKQIIQAFITTASMILVPETTAEMNKIEDFTTPVPFLEKAPLTPTGAPFVEETTQSANFRETSAVKVKNRADTTAPYDYEEFGTTGFGLPGEPVDDVLEPSPAAATVAQTYGEATTAAGFDYQDFTTKGFDLGGGEFGPTVGEADYDMYETSQSEFY